MRVAEAASPVRAPVGRRAARAPVLLWCGTVAAGVAWGQLAGGWDVGLGAAPLVGRWDPRVPPLLLVAAVLVAAVVLGGPRLAADARWRDVPVVAGVSSVALAVVVAAADGWHRLTAPLTTRYEYEPFAASIDSPRAFVRDFVARVPEMPTHPKAHPPLATLVPWGLDRIGLGGAGWFAALVIASWGVAVAACLIAVRAVAGEAAARRSAPALVLAPAMLWAATSADALFTGVAAVGVALAVVRPGSRRWAVAGGAVLGVALLLSYGLVLVLLLPVAVAWQRRTWGDALASIATAGAVVAVAALAGFWWFDGLAAAREAYWAGLAGERPIAYLTLAGNPAAFALAVGPAAVASLRRAPLLTWAALGAVLVANASLLSAGEVERIWLPFVPWVVAAAPGDDRRWLAAQGAVLLALAMLLRSTW